MSHFPSDVEKSSIEELFEAGTITQEERDARLQAIDERGDSDEMAVDASADGDGGGKGDDENTPDAVYVLGIDFGNTHGKLVWRFCVCVRVNFLFLTGCDDSDVGRGRRTTSKASCDCQ